MCPDKYVFGVSQEVICTNLLKTHLKADQTNKSLYDMVCEAKAMETAKQANKLMMDSQGMEETVHFTQQKHHKDMRLKHQPGTCHWCGDNRGAHPWKDCPANGRTCSKCGGNDHFAQVCLEMSSRPSHPQTFDNRSRPDHSRKRVQTQTATS